MFRHFRGTMSKLQRFFVAVGLTLGLAVGTSGTAFAATGSAAAVPLDSAPGCSSVSQIGTTGYITIAGQTYASVKQYVGCSKNYAYVYVWQSWRNTHSSWNSCAAIGVGTTLQDTNCGNGVEVWSFGANTVSQCTYAIGWEGDGPVPDGPSGTTDTRC